MDYFTKFPQQEDQTDTDLLVQTWWEILFYFSTKEKIVSSYNVAEDHQSRITFQQLKKKKDERTCRSLQFTAWQQLEMSQLGVKKKGYLCQWK